jgi:hypothetical protein
MPLSTTSPFRAIRRMATALCVSALLPTVAAAHPYVIVQANPYVGGGATFLVTSNIGQTFTPAFDSLSVVELWLMDSMPSHDVTNTLAVNIFALDGTLLGSSGPQLFANGYGGGTVALSHVDFTPIALVPSTKYVIGFDISSSGDFSDLVIAAYDPGTYAAGGLWVWSTRTENQTIDLTFTEGPAAGVPEPTSMLLFGVAMLGYAGRRYATR